MTKSGASSSQVASPTGDEQEHAGPAAAATTATTATAAVGTRDFARLSKRFSSSRPLSLISVSNSLLSAWTPTPAVSSLIPSSPFGSTTHAEQSSSPRSSTPPPAASLLDGHIRAGATRRDTNSYRISALFRVFNPRSKRSARIIDSAVLDPVIGGTDADPDTTKADYHKLSHEGEVACFSPSDCNCVVASDGSCTAAPRQLWRRPVSFPGAFRGDVLSQGDDYVESPRLVDSPIPRPASTSILPSTTNASEDNPTPPSPHLVSSGCTPSGSRFPTPALAESISSTSHRHDRSHEWCTWRCGCLLDQDVRHECYLRPPSPFWDTSPLLGPRPSLSPDESEIALNIDFDLLADMPALSLNSASTASSSDAESPAHSGTPLASPRSPRKRPDMHLNIVPTTFRPTLSPTLLSPTPVSPGSWDPYPERPDEECEGWPRISVYGRPTGFEYNDVPSPRTPGFDLTITRSSSTGMLQVPAPLDSTSQSRSAELRATSNLRTSTL